MPSDMPPITSIRSHPPIAAPGTRNFLALAIGQQAIDFLLHVDHRVHLLALQVKQGPRSGANLIPVPLVCCIESIETGLRLPSLLHEAAIARRRLGLQLANLLHLFRRQARRSPRHHGVTSSHARPHTRAHPWHATAILAHHPWPVSATCPWLHSIPRSTHHSGSHAIPTLRTVFTISIAPCAPPAPAMRRPVTHAAGSIAKCEETRKDDKNHPQSDPESNFTIHYHLLSQNCFKAVAFMPADFLAIESSLAFSSDTPVRRSRHAHIAPCGRPVLCCHRRSAPLHRKWRPTISPTPQSRRR